VTLRDPTLSRANLAEHLRLLRAERGLALTCALADDAQYMEDLEDELEATIAGLVSSCVIELARARARHCTPQG
jgi:hypothetical protein